MIEKLLVVLLSLFVSVFGSSSGGCGSSYLATCGQIRESAYSALAEGQKAVVGALTALHGASVSSAEWSEEATEPGPEISMTYGDRGCFVVDGFDICVPMWADFMHYNTPGNGLCQEWYGHRMLAGHVQNDNWRNLYDVKAGDVAHLYFPDGSYISFRAIKSALASSSEMRILGETEPWYRQYKWLSATCAGSGRHWYVVWAEIEVVGQRASDVASDVTSVTRYE